MARISAPNEAMLLALGAALRIYSINTRGRVDLSRKAEKGWAASQELAGPQATGVGSVVLAAGVTGLVARLPAAARGRSLLCLRRSPAPSTPTDVTQTNCVGREVNHVDWSGVV